MSENQNTVVGNVVALSCIPITKIIVDDPIKEPETQSCDVPPKLLPRNFYGLVSDGSVNYTYSNEGYIDWRKLVPQKYLVPNKQRTQETDVSKLEDKDLLILLAGIRYLAQIRGYSNVAYRVAAASDSYVSVVCSINFIANYETDNLPRTFEAIGDASLNNTESFAKLFLSATAENRAFVRCVRNFLNINVLAQEELPEINSAAESPFPNSPHLILQQLMDDKKYTFEKIKDKMIKSGVENADKWVKLEDIPESQVISIIEKINKKKAKLT